MKVLSGALAAEQRKKDNAPCGKIDINTFGHSARTGEALAEDEVYGENILHYDSYVDWHSRFALMDNGKAIVAACRPAPNAYYNGQYYLEKNIIDLTTAEPDVETIISETESAWTAVANNVTCTTSKIETEEGTCSAHIAYDTAGTLTGRVTFTYNSTIVTGSGTYFTTELAAGRLIKVANTAAWYTVSSIQSDTSLYISSVYASGTVTDTLNATQFMYTPAAGLLARKTISPTDLTSAKYIRFFIMVPNATGFGTSGLYLRLALDNSADCLSPLAYLDIPTLSTGNWTEMTLQLPNPSLLSSIVSIGLYMVGTITAFPLHIFLENIKSVESDCCNWERLNGGVAVSTDYFSTGLATHGTEVLIFTQKPSDVTQIGYWQSTNSGVTFGSFTSLATASGEDFLVRHPITALFNDDGNVAVVWGCYQNAPIPYWDYTYYKFRQRVSGSWQTVTAVTSPGYPLNPDKAHYIILIYDPNDAYDATNTFTHHSYLFYYNGNWFVQFSMGGTTPSYFSFCVPVSCPGNVAGEPRYFSINAAYSFTPDWSFTDVSGAGTTQIGATYPEPYGPTPMRTEIKEQRRYGERYTITMTGGGIDLTISGIVLMTENYGAVLYTGSSFMLMTLGQTIDDVETLVFNTTDFTKPGTGDYSFVYWDKGLSIARLGFSLPSISSICEYAAEDKDIWRITNIYVSKTIAPVNFLSAVLNGTLEETTGTGAGATVLTITTADTNGRLLALQGNDQSTEPYLITLDNSDLVYATLGAGTVANIIKGSQVSIYKGYTINGVDTYPTTPISKLFINDFGWGRIDGTPVFMLECISGWAVANRTTAQIPIFWNYYDPEEATVYDIIGQIITHLGGTLTYTSRSAEILAMYPKFAIGTGDNLGNALRDLMELVPDELIFTGVDANIIYPQTTDASVYNYTFEEL